ncbi:MAG TPA: hypothetical protein VNO18_20775 [Xanthobacteraceae bacterium]|nr:hypothetical protein [Xanthobacteraceae bacterium]
MDRAEGSHGSAAIGGAVEVIDVPAKPGKMIQHTASRKDKLRKDKLAAVVQK